MESTGRGFWRSLALWVAAMAGAYLLYALLSGHLAGLFLYRRVPGVLLALVAGVLPFAVFAAASSARTRPRTLLLPLAVVGAFTTLADGWLTPTLRYEPGADPAAEAQLEEMGVPGPPTVVNLLRRRRYVLDHPPESYLASTSQPHRQPPNWLAFLAAMPFAAGLLTVFNGALGAMIGHGLPENARLRRIHRIWLVGLGLFAGIMLVFSLVGDAVRSRQAAPGPPGALTMILVPIAGILYARRLDPDRLTYDDHDGDAGE